MRENIFWLIMSGLLLALLNGCSGAMPAVPYDEYIKTHPKEVKHALIPVKKEKVSNRSQITHLPGGGVRYNSAKGIGVEMESYEDEYGEVDIVTPFFGNKSPAYNQGRREAEAEIRWMKESSEIDFAIRKGEADGRRGVYSPGGISFKFLREYQEAFDDARADFSLQENEERKDLEYQQGWDDAFEKAGIPTR